MSERENVIMYGLKWLVQVSGHTLFCLGLFVGLGDSVVLFVGWLVLRVWVLVLVFGFFVF